MERTPLAIVGCGGMGGRHLLGLKELYGSDLCNVDLVAVCDLRRDNAARLADRAAELLGRRPLVYGDMGRMVSELPELQAAAVTTDTGSHHVVARAALELGLHVLCEKPLALTIRGCNLILAAQQRGGKVLSVAENYRRDPMARLTRALLDAGAIGDRYMLFDVSASAGSRIIILPWRHDRNVGGILLDGGVHNADVMQFYMGDAQQVYARAKLWEPTRYKPTSRSSVSDFYEPWYDEMPDSIQATAEDTLVSVIDFQNGTIGQWTAFYAAHGQGFGVGAIYGSRGSLRVGGIRSGRSPVLHAGDDGEVTGQPLLDRVPGFRLDPVTAQLFGGERLAAYGYPFPEADRKLLAIEYHEFAECVQQGKAPEVDGVVARRDIALCYAAFESSLLNRPVTLDEIESGEVASYEAEINAHWRI